jgi:REP element-mobilizing transposase RayT
MYFLTEIKERLAMNKTDYHIPLYKGDIYHIYNRGNGNENIFYKHENYIYFLNQYYKFIGNLVDTFAFCLLPNHFHLLVRIKIDAPEILSKAFRNFFISYSMSINKQQGRKGSLFQRGFKRKLIDDEKYFYAAIYYIHSNPVHHKMIQKLNNYKYSSYNILISEKNTRLQREEIFDWFNGKENFIEYHIKKRNKVFDDSFILED